jgi:hypothetical protein
VIAAFLLPTPVPAGTTTLMPGVTYTREVRSIGGGPVVLHILRSPGHGGLHALRPVLSHGTVTGRQTVPAMQARVSGRATVAGVNGDFFNFDGSGPNGVFLRDGVIATRPHPQRSSLGIGFDGRLVVDLLSFVGTWTVPGYPAHPLEALNRGLVNPPGVALYTRAYGARTPRHPTAKEVVLIGFPRSHVNGYLTGTASSIRLGGGTVIPRGGAVLHARGTWRRTLVGQARPGTPVTVRLRLDDLPVDVADLIGGGPALVRNGNPIWNAGEAFTRGHLITKHPRTAVGQLANGRLLLVVADGRRQSSIGLTNWELARQMVRLGAVRAMSLDGGGSSTMAFDGRVLNRPSDGAPRAVANGLFVFYYGIYAPRAPRSVISPNRDRVIDSQVLTAKVVRRSSVDLRLLRPNGTIAWRLRDTVGPRQFRRPVGVPGMAEGTWRWVVEATEVASGRASHMERRFVVNRTLGHLRLFKERMLVTTGSGGRLGFSVGLTRRASLHVSVRSSSGRLVRVLFRGQLGRGRHAWRWRGRNASRRVVPTGTYTIHVVARNGLGAVSLADAVRVVRVRG